MYIYVYLYKCIFHNQIYKDMNLEILKLLINIM